MNPLELFRQWTEAYPSTIGLIKYLLWVVAILIVVQFLRRFLRKNLPNTSTRYKSQKGIELIGYILLVLISLSYFTGTIRDLTLAIGLLTAGITITLQELILSIAGSIYIFFSKVYKPGDRIEINGIKGDVIDIDSIYTTMMEIGQWISSDNYSGRIVKLSNAFVFRGPVYNYSKDFPFIWDEINIPIRYGSDMELAQKIILESAHSILTEYVSQSIEKWKEIVQKYYIEDAVVQPTLSLSMTDNWMQFNLRFISDYRKRRKTKNELHQSIAKAIQSTHGTVALASTTFEIVNIPKIKIEQND